MKRRSFRQSIIPFRVIRGRSGMYCMNRQFIRFFPARLPSIARSAEFHFTQSWARQSQAKGSPPLSLSRSLASTLSLSSKSSENNGKSNSAAEANETGKKVFCAESEGARERGAGHCNRKGGAKRWTWLRRRSRSPSHNQPCSRRLTWVRPLKAGSALVLLRMCLQLKPFCNNLFLGD